MSLKWVLYIQSMAAHDAVHYPDRLDKLFMINVPSFVSNSWDFLTKFLDDEAKSRVFLKAGEDSWRPALEAAMDPKILPKHMGGQTGLSLHGLCPTMSPLKAELAAIPPSSPQKPRAQSDDEASESGSLEAEEELWR